MCLDSQLLGLPSHYPAIPKQVTKNFSLGCRWTSLGLMQPVFPCLLPPRNPMGIRGWLMTAGRQGPWELGSILVLQVRHGVAQRG